MKVLWISHSPGNYNSHNHVGSGGWVQSLQLLVEKEGDIELGLAFVHPKDSAPVKQGNTTYFPIRSFFGGSKAKMLLSRLLFQERREAQRRIQRLLKVISEFKPDLIHIWGCEHYYRFLLVVHVEILFFFENPTRLAPDHFKRHLVNSSDMNWEFSCWKYGNEFDLEKYIELQNKKSEMLYDQYYNDNVNELGVNIF